MKASSRIPFILVAACVALPAWLPETHAQPSPPAQPTQPAPLPQTAPAPNGEAKPLATMRALKATIAEAEAELQTKRDALRAAESPAEQDQIGAEIVELNNRLNALKSDFEEVASGTDLNAFTEKPDEGADLGAEVQDFLKPIVKQLKEMTSRPREIEELKNNVAYYTKRKQMAEKALQKIIPLLAF